MSQCSNRTCKPFKRSDVKIFFTDYHELEYHIPLNLMNRHIDHFEVDGERYTRQRKHVESCEVKELDT